VTSNRPPSKRYEPKYEIAATWLDLARKRARKEDAPFQGRGNLNALKTAIENGLITDDEVEEVFCKCKSVAPEELSKVFNKLWVLNGQKHFPLVPLETDGNLIVPPSLPKVLEEYLSQLDYVANAFQQFLPSEERKSNSHRNGELLTLFYNPGTRVSPDEYDDWVSQWFEDGLPKERWHEEIAITVKLPNVQSAFERWNQTLRNPRRLTPNGVEIIERPSGSKKRWADKLQALVVDKQAQGSAASEPELQEPTGYPPLDLEKLLLDTRELVDAKFPTTLKRKASNDTFAAKVIGNLVDQVFPARYDTDFEDLYDLSEKEYLAEVKQQQRNQSNRERLQIQWVNSFAAVNDIAIDMFGRNLEGLHPKIIDDIALRSLALIREKGLNAGARDLLIELRPQIPDGPIARPIFDR